MSWSLSVGPVDPSELRAAVEAKLEEYLASVPSIDTPEMREQANAALDCAEALAGVVGDGPVSVGLHGHANPGHEITPGWSNDTVTVSVQSEAQRPPATEAEADMVDSFRQAAGGPDSGSPGGATLEQRAQD